MAKEIAGAEGIPAHFLAKILQQLARKGLLRSQKGPTGGFCLGKPAKDVRLIDIVDAIDGVDHQARCALGLPECSDRMSCPAHRGWTALHSRIMDYLRRTTLGSLLKQWEVGKPARPARVARESNHASRPSV